jgi:lipid-A-disaccharide synthase
VNKRIYLIAGEASGDILGAKLIQALKKNGRELDLFGIGGERMQGEGLSSIFPMRELSLLGFIEILPHIPRMLRRIKQTIAHIEKIQPDLIITIDSPGFTGRIADILREKKHPAPIIHYVAPSVWAYKPERALRMLRRCNHLLALLPFETPYFHAVGLPCTFVGHPCVEDIEQHSDLAENIAWRARNNIAADAQILCILPGSRASELRRLLPIFLQVAARLSQESKNLQLVLPVASGAEEQIKKIIKQQQNDLPIVLITHQQEKLHAFKNARMALAKSGTVTMELAAAGCPMVMAYRVNPISAWMLRRMIKISHVNLLNLMANETLIPECLQEECNAESIWRKLQPLWDDENLRHHQMQRFRELMWKLGANQQPTPSERAAAVIERFL